MAQIIGLPKLSPTMEEGVLVKWVKKEGDHVEPGDLVAEVETDKANMDFNLEDEGVLLKLLVGEGETVKLGAPVAILGDPDEDISGLLAAATTQSVGGSAENSTEANEPATPSAPPPGTAAHPESVPQYAKQPSSTHTTVSTSSSPPAREHRVLASPLAKTLAIELGIDLRTISGTGPGGRIVERDVRNHSLQKEASISGASTAVMTPVVVDSTTAASPSSPSSPSTQALAVVPRSEALATLGGGDEYVDEPLSGMRKTIAARLTAAKQEIPHFRVTTSFNAAPLLLFRKRLNELIGDRGKISINDLLLKGAALALRRVPKVNAAFVGDAIRYFTRVHLGVAVALERGLITPVIRNADLKGIGVISAEVKDVVGRAKKRAIKAHEITGSTFTISNLGMFGVDHFDAIINPPEAAILAVGRINELPVVEDDRITIGKRMNLTLSCDHRVVDGALGARFLDELVDLLERPESLAL